MMKKIFLTVLALLFSFNSAFAIRALSEDDYEQFRKSLHLNQWQKTKIEEIEANAQKEKQPYYDLLKANDISNDKRREAQEKVHELDLEKDKQILKILNIKQQFMYKEFNSRQT